MGTSQAQLQDRVRTERLLNKAVERLSTHGARRSEGSTALTRLVRSILDGPPPGDDTQRLSRAIDKIAATHGALTEIGAAAGGSVWEELDLCFEECRCALAAAVTSLADGRNVNEPCAILERRVDNARWYLREIRSELLGARKLQPEAVLKRYRLYERFDEALRLFDEARRSIERLRLRHY